MQFSNLLTEYSMIATAAFYLFIALHLMQNPIGWCCGWLKIPELAREIFRRAQYQWLGRAILHQAQGVFPVFVFQFSLFPFLSPPPKIKKCGTKNKHLLTSSYSISPKNPSTLRRKNPQTPSKIFLSNVEISISEVKIPFFGPKKRRKPVCLGLSPLR